MLGFAAKSPTRSRRKESMSDADLEQPLSETEDPRSASENPLTESRGCSPDDSRARAISLKIAAARECLERHPLFRGHTDCFRFAAEGDLLVIVGRLPSFYLKQQLQTAVMQIAGETQVDNRVEVCWPPIDVGVDDVE